MTLDDLRRACELLPAGASLTLPREAVLAALEDIEAPAELRIGAPAVEVDRWLTVDDVAEAMNVSRRYVYEHRAEWSFTKQLPGGAVRFSEKGLRRFMERVG